MTPLPPSGPPNETPQPYSAFAQRFTQPPGKLYLLHGDDAVFHLSHTIAASALRLGMRLAVADGGNWFNVHTIINFARTAQLNPDEMLRRIFISRSFTCYQMEQTIAHLLPGFLKTIRSDAAFIFGLLDTLYDEQAPLREVRHILRRVLSALQAMKADGISVLVTCLHRSVVPEERNHLFEILSGAVDQVYRLQLDEHQAPLLVQEYPRALPTHNPPAIHTTGDSHGTHRTDLHEHHRQRAGKLVQIPPRTSPRRPGRL